MGEPAITTFVNTKRVKARDPLLPPVRPPAFVDDVPQAGSFRQQGARVFIQRDAHKPRWTASDVIDWTSIDVPMDGNDNTATLIVKLDAEKTHTEHFAEIIEALSAERRVRIATQSGRQIGQVLFQGVPQAHTLQWSPQSQSMTVTCLSEGQVRLRHGIRQQVTGRHMRFTPGVAWNIQSPDHLLVTSLACVFNEGGQPNRAGIGPSGFLPFYSADGNVALYLFSTNNHPLAGRWTYVDALRYVCYHYILRGGAPIDVSDFIADTDELVGEAPQPHASDPFIRKITAICDDNVSIQSMNVDEALLTLCSRAGLHYQIETATEETSRGGFTVTYKLRVFASLEREEDAFSSDRLMRMPKRGDLPRGRPFSDYSAATAQEIAEANKVSQAHVTIDRRVITRPKFIAGYEEIEATFLMRPGWKPDNERLDNMTTDAEITAALTLWQDDFADVAYEMESGAPKSRYHAAHPQHHEVADVFRLWFFPDGLFDLWEFADEPDPSTDRIAWWFWSRAKYSPYITPDEPGPNGQYGGLWYGASFAFGGAEIDPGLTVQWLPRRRPFGETIGRANAATTDTAPKVRIHFGTAGVHTPPPANDPKWIEFAGHVQIDTERAAIRFVEDNPYDSAPFHKAGNRYETAIKAYLERRFWVSVTATVRSDRRLTCMPTARGASGAVSRCKMIDLGYERFRRRLKSARSHLLGYGYLEAEPAFMARDDTAVFERYCQRAADQMAIESVGGSASIFWTDRTYACGDTFTGISGLSIAFAQYPAVERVRYVKSGAGGGTQLVLTDMRHATEVGME